MHHPYAFTGKPMCWFIQSCFHIEDVSFHILGGKGLHVLVGVRDQHILVSAQAEVSLHQTSETVWRQFWLLTCWGSSGIQCVEAKDIAKHPTIHEQAPHNVTSDIFFETHKIYGE